MSDTWILIVPKLPKHVPSPNNAEAALKLLQNAMPEVDEIEIVQSEKIQFFDCGASLETITCPRCRANINFDWWGNTMSSDFDEKSGFQLREYRLPCCAASTSLNELIYAFHQAFGCFALSAMTPNIAKMSDGAVSEIEAALDCDVTVVYRHI